MCTVNSRARLGALVARLNSPELPDAASSVAHCRVKGRLYIYVLAPTWWSCIFRDPGIYFYVSLAAARALRMTVSFPDNASWCVKPVRQMANKRPEADNDPDESKHERRSRVRDTASPPLNRKSKTGLSGGAMTPGTADADTATRKPSPGDPKNEARCAAGVIENVVLLGAPVGASRTRWQRVSRMVHGRLVNGYAKSDMILGLVFRAKSLSLSVAGVQKVRGC